MKIFALVFYSKRLIDNKITMTQKKFEDPVYSKQVAEFITVTYDFCLFIEKSEDTKLELLYSYLQKVLPLLYIKVTLLPDIEVSDESANERFVTEENWETLYTILKNKIGIDDIYSTQHNIDMFDNEPFNASLAEDIADIYQDIKDFIILYQKKSHIGKENAVSSVKYYFKCNWGYKALNVLKMIHTISYKESLAEILEQEL